MGEKRRNVILRKSFPTSEEYIPNGPVLRRGIPTAIDEKTARDLVKSHPAKFRLATKADFPKKKKSRSKRPAGPAKGEETSSPAPLSEKE